MSIPILTKNQNNQKKTLTAWMIILAAWIIMTVAPLIYQDKTGRLFADYYDRSFYFERGKWFINNTIPTSEYPQIPTLLFGINHITSNWLDNPNMQMQIYVAVFSLEMLIVLFLVFKKLVELLPFQLSKYAYLVLLPPSLYFTFNRFDILPTYFCLLAYGFARNKRWGAASIVLAIATFTKWYPALLFPGFFVYASLSNKKFQWKMVFIFLTICTLILLPTLVMGGIDTILAPYKFHAERGMEYIALPVLIYKFLSTSLNINLQYFLLLFLVLQFLAPILLLSIKIDTLEFLINYSIITIGMFILFSRIWSPQWFLWLLPFLVLSTRTKKDAGIIIAYSLIMYIAFPLIFDIFGMDSFQLRAVGLFGYFILFTIIIRSIMKLKNYAQPIIRIETLRKLIAENNWFIRQK